MATPSAPSSTQAGPDVIAALQSAVIWAVLALGICVPIIAWRTDVDITNSIILVPRWGLVGIIVAVVFGDRLFTALVPISLPTIAIPQPSPEFSRRASQLGLLALLLFPAFTLAVIGPSGAIKWVDNFGVQILIYIMLGWGLNIVVGLAGLLDLG